jgi:hypothetical protein
VVAAQSHTGIQSNLEEMRARGEGEPAVVRIDAAAEIHGNEAWCF